MKVKTEDPAPYEVVSGGSEESDILDRAFAILSSRLGEPGDVMGKPDTVKAYLTLLYGTSEHEEFGCMWLDAQNRLIKSGTLFRGTLTQTSVYPREVLKEGLACNAAAVILYHNHPSGSTLPSSADVQLTNNLKTALAYVDIRVLDHIIVGGLSTCSFAEQGLI